MFRQSVSEILGGGAESAPPPPGCEMGPKSPALLGLKKKKKKQLRCSEVNYLNYTKRPNFACGNYIFPKTRGNKNKQWVHSTPL